jgi:hypothetical protein
LLLSIRTINFNIYDTCFILKTQKLKILISGPKSS